MKKFTAFLFMAVLVFAFAATAHAAEKKLYTTGDVNLRKGPGLNYGVTTSVKKGTILNYAGSTKKDNRKVNWYKVTYNKKTAWVSSKYAKFTKTVKTTGNVNLRLGPGLNFKEYTSVAKGTILSYLNVTKQDDRGVNWFKVSYNGKEVWVSSRYAQFN